MAWAVWLAVPVAVTLLVALWTWVRGLPPRRPSTTRAIRDHGEYLDTLATTARDVAAEHRRSASNPNSDVSG